MRSHPQSSPPEKTAPKGQGCALASALWSPICCRGAPDDEPGQGVRVAEEALASRAGRILMLLFEWGEYATESDGGERLDGSGFQLREDDGRALAWNDDALAAEGVAIFGVAGVSYRLDAAQSDAFAPGRLLSLVPDPENEFDPNAIGVWDQERRDQVGFVPADRAAELGSRLAREQLAAVVLWEWRKEGKRCALRALMGPTPLVQRVQQSAARLSAPGAGVPAGEVERDGEDQRPEPPVHGVGP
jgi:hypothetical protein